MTLAQDTFNAWHVVTVLLSGVVAFFVALATAWWQRRTELSKFRQSHRVEAVFKASDGLAAWWRYAQAEMQTTLALYNHGPGTPQYNQTIYLCDNAAAVVDGQGEAHLATARGYIHLLGYPDAVRALDELTERTRFTREVREATKAGSGRSVPSVDWSRERYDEATKQYRDVFDHLERALQDEYRDDSKRARGS